MITATHNIVAPPQNIDASQCNLPADGPTPRAALHRRRRVSPFEWLTIANGAFAALVSQATPAAAAPHRRFGLALPQAQAQATPVLHVPHMIRNVPPLPVPTQPMRGEIAASHLTPLHAFNKPGGQRVAVRRDEDLTLDLESMPGSGYVWQVRSSLGRPIEHDLAAVSQIGAQTDATADEPMQLVTYRWAASQLQRAPANFSIHARLRRGQDIQENLDFSIRLLS